MMLKIILFSIIYVIIGNIESITMQPITTENCSIAVNNFTQYDPPFARFCGYAYIESQTPGECDTRIYYLRETLVNS